MNKVVLVALCCAALVIGLLPGSALADHRPNSYCSPTGDYCQSATRPRGARLLIFESFAHRGKVRVCVNAPTNSRACVDGRFRDVDDDGVFTIRLKWKKHFPDEGPGAYTVVWRQNGSRTGKKLGFHRG